MSPVHLRNLGFQRNQPEDREGLSRTRRPGGGHLGYSGYGSSSSAPPTPQRPFSMQNGQQEVQPSILSQPRVLALLLDGCGNSTWSPDGANWSRHVLYGQLAPLGVLWFLRHNPSQPSFMASGHILPSLAFLAKFHLTNPQAFIFHFGPGGSFYLLGVSGPPSHHHWPLANPFHYGGLGLNGLFGPFRPPTASTVRKPRSAVRRPIRPLLA
ncbi:hypothetical protein O181_110243 [Austropuccinia psidii MF-1]|uniref:Uncharacterized protein n=1 Tax=Austropuccinia psidii MF-1 TaxID=1389203 RepID=A0A9Q3PQL5_9BASI|nr:hypothetical protein [Austropuccinia psidii MF-1]